VSLITDLLRDQFRVLRFDPSASTVGGLVDQIDQIRAELGEERWYVLGHSWGAALAALYAARYPERVSGLVLAHPLEISSEFCRSEDSWNEWDDCWEHNAHLAEALWEDLEAVCPDASGEGYDLRPAAMGVIAPALVLLGQRDAIDQRSGRCWAELTRARLVTWPEAGHWSFLERPQEFRLAVTEFLMACARQRAVAAA
jgi:pimeloyl-ACP methyl ester carboxylesterase